MKYFQWNGEITGGDILKRHFKESWSGSSNSMSINWIRELGFPRRYANAVGG